jgi:AcrR family transcriptional regulator
LPTGVALRDVREQLFGAAERVLLRAGPNALTSRAVTAEADCAKGVLHKHFTDFDGFLVELVQDRTAHLTARSDALRESAGSGDAAVAVAGFLADVFGPVGLGIVGLIIFRDELRTRLRRSGHTGIPVLTDAAGVLSVYLAAERDAGRIAADADVDTLALTLIGTAHLVFAGREGVPPDAGEVREFVVSVLGGALREH